MKYLITGASGFIGNTLYKELEKAHDVIGVSRTHSDQNIDLSSDKIRVGNETIDRVICCAGLAHQKKATYKEYILANVDSIRNTLGSFEVNLPKVIIYLSSVNVYGIEKGKDIDEETPLNGKTFFAKTKIMAEELVVSWCKKNEVDYCILRLPLVVAHRPPGNLGKMIAHIKKGTFFFVNQGKARKSMVLASDIATLTQQKKMLSGVYNLTDGHHPSFYEVGSSLAGLFRVKQPINIPLKIAKFISSIGDLFPILPFNSKVLTQMTQDCTYNDARARDNLSWDPKKILDNLENIDSK